MSAVTSAPAGPVRFAEIRWRDRPVRIEYAWVGDDGPRRPTVVFLHEGLGSLALWRDFPQRFCAACGARGLVYSRPGYGRSSLPAGEPRDVDYLHVQAHEVLPAFLEAAGIASDAPAPWFFGHSDGGTIALLHAARFPGRAAGVIAVAPHLFVEDVTVAGVERARTSYAATDWRARLERHHADPDWVFASWIDIWLDPRFRGWNIEREMEAIACPVLAAQGVDDEYGTMEQVRSIARHVPGAEVLEISGAGHSPHRDQPGVLIEAGARFIARHSGGAR
jgi:pimeloyl-ACP methyl ester carboxylesterase